MGGGVYPGDWEWEEDDDYRQSSWSSQGHRPALEALGECERGFPAAWGLPAQTLRMLGGGVTATLAMQPADRGGAEG